MNIDDNGRYVDLHVHSTYSDGTFTPKELVLEAQKKGLTYMALTDHDTVAGVSEIIECAKGTGVKIIPGMELSCEFTTKDLHILGLNIDYTNKTLLRKLADCQNARRNRNKKMAENMKKLGMEADIFLDGDISVTRANFAGYMVDKGYAASINEAFSKYLDPGKPVYEKVVRISPKEGIKLIKEAEGHPVLAHPYLYLLDEAGIRDLVCGLKDAGLEGLEVIYSLFDEKQVRFLMDLADELDLYITGGSDFHGANKPHISLGTGLGNLKVPETLIKNIL